MEDILAVYERPENPRRPVVCFDERPCQLLEGKELPIQQGAGGRRVDSHYKRNGTCCVLLAVQPRGGKRVLEVRSHRRSRDYAQFLKRLATREYPEVERIVLVQDNLNTHQMGSLYETYPPEQARALAEGVLSFLVDEEMKKGIPFGLLRTEGGVYAREEVYAERGG